MNIIVNDETKTIADGATLQELIQMLELSEKKGIAVAVNDAVVTRSSWPSSGLADSDKVTIIQATQGG